MTGYLHRMALRTLNNLLNRALALDPGTRAALAELAGQSLNVDCLAPPLKLSAGFTASGDVILESGQHPEARVSLQGTAVSLALLAVNARQRGSLADSGVRLSGDQELVRELGAILGDLDIDWEAALATLVGDIPAHLAGRAARRAARWQRGAAQRSLSGLGEYLREESHRFVGRDEAETWFADVRLLANDTDRLAARLDKLRRPPGET